MQLDRLAGIDSVSRAQQERGLQLVGMFFDLSSARCTVLDPATNAFVADDEHPDRTLVTS
ncbi:hypothetical protein [uncultured Jatrophihabitans sp.]|uniref:hypothetical protein n=1 Tax=uncultured Jatrophihabitans sp. TaxID=1610747 RepID=UPI0035CA7125